MTPTSFPRDTWIAKNCHEANKRRVVAWLLVTTFALIVSAIILRNIENWDPLATGHSWLPPVWIILGVVLRVAWLPVAWLILAFHLWRSFRPAMTRFLDPLKDPTIWTVRRRGETEFGDTSRSIEREYCGKPFLTSAGISVTENYVVLNQYFTFEAHFFDDLLWAYKCATKHSVNFIPTGTTHSAILVFYSGTIEIPLSDRDVDRLMIYSQERSPWAFIGFSDELETLLAEKPGEFLTHVERRRAPPEIPF
jgi:hypothetical protein